MNAPLSPASRPPLKADIVAEPLANDRRAIARSIIDTLVYRIGKDPATASRQDLYQAAAQVVRDRLVSRWMDTTRRQYAQDVKRIYYLSMEFLVGRTFSNALHALGLYDEFAGALEDIGLEIGMLADEEHDAALGNGGLGRLAACFLDSMATLDLPGYGYGIRYDYGMFAQRIHDGWQVEMPDDWLKDGSPWEFARAERTFEVHFGGHVTHDAAGAHWHPAETVLAMPHDMIVPGAGTESVMTLRLWHAKSAEPLDLGLFNQGDYMQSVRNRTLSENVTRVLYPDDSSRQGRELRLRQEFFFVSASVQDILARYLHDHDRIERIGEKVAIHLNDTHPAIAVPELMRLLVDRHRVGWDRAWALCGEIFSYTNHTIMPEALETWPIDMLGGLLPRHLEIIYEINRRFMNEVRAKHGNDEALLARMSIIDHGYGGRVRMAWLSVVASHQVNGVSRLHSDLIQRTIFADFAAFWPERFCNKTNGITPRRWLSHANRELAQLMKTSAGIDVARGLDELPKLRPLADDPQFRQAFARIKHRNKERLAAYLQANCGVTVDPASMFDVQIKRMHEYKRQLLNVLHIVWRYQAILAAPDAGWTPRTVIFAGKAASAYRMAKLVIKLINDVAQRINHDPRVNGLLKVVFVPNYGVTVAETIIPAADLSEQISTAGTEASGTGNMKLSLNGALTIGTLDGANVEIREQVGEDNIFIFGLTTPEAARIRLDGYNPNQFVERDPSLRAVLHAIGDGTFSPDDPGRFAPIVDSLTGGDQYLLLADFAAYVACQRRVDAAFAKPDEWQRMAVLNVAGMAMFSSDRTIAEYARDIWHVEPLKH
ncbi:MAG: glycogen/starch/alpha-glucan phosphorylase [Lautropia sp.]